MKKIPGARPSAGTVSNRLDSIIADDQPAVSQGLARLADSNLQQIVSQQRTEAKELSRLSRESKRAKLHIEAERDLLDFSTRLYDAILSSASAASASRRQQDWVITLGEASLNSNQFIQHHQNVDELGTSV